MKQSAPAKISIPEDIASRCDGPNQLARTAAAMRHMLSVPRAEILRREAEYKRVAALNPNRRGPKPKIKTSASDHAADAR